MKAAHLSLLTSIILLALVAHTQAQISISGNISDGSGGPLLSGNVYHAGSLVVPTGTTLTIQAGAVVKFVGTADSIVVNGHLEIAGTSGNPAILTVEEDDTAGGDTNGDGSATIPAIGSWRGIQISATAGTATINEMDMRYTGNFGFAAFRTTGASGVTLTNSKISEFVGSAIDLGNNGLPTISNCSFENGDRPGRNIPIEAIPGFSNNTATGCSLMNSWSINSGSVDASQSIDAVAMMNGAFIVEIGITIVNGVTLTLGAGVNMKFTGASLSIQNAGTLICNGTAGSNVNLTVYADDSVGGDSNLDGASVGTPGSWRGLQCSNQETGSNLSFTNIRFSGNFSFAGIAVNSTSPTFTNCSVTDCSADGVTFASANNGATFTDCSFDRNNRSVNNVHIDDVSNFVNCTATDNITSDIMRVTSGAITVDTTISANNLLAGALEVATSLTVSAGLTMTFNAGVVLKFPSASSNIAVNGTLIANGTAGSPVVMTTLDDDTHGGDSNKDGPSMGTPGNNRGINFGNTSTGCSLTHMIVRFGGNFSFPGIAVNDTDPVLTNCTVEDCSAVGMNIAAGTASPTVTDCNFDRNSVSVQTVTIETLANFSGNNASGNTVSNAIRSTDSTLDSDLTLNTDNVIGSVLVSQSAINIPVGITFNLGSVMTIKFSSASLNINVNGVLNCAGTSFGPVTFTVLTDDSVGGDTNRDGGATTPAPGNWRGLVFQASSGPCTLEHTRLRYAGNFSIPAISLSSGDFSMSNGSVSDCSASAVNFGQSNISPSIRECDFSNNTRSFDNVRLTNLKNLRDNTAAGNSLSNSARLVSSTVGPDDVILKRSLIDGVLICESAITVGAGASLRVEPGCIFKFGITSGNIGFSGGLTRFLGSGLEPIVFTTIDDDEFGGDTNLDGPSTGSPGNWRGINTGGTGAALGEFRHLLIRYAGNSNFTAFTCNSGNFLLDAIRVEHSGIQAMTISNSFGDMDNFVAFNCTNGIKLTGGVSKLRHATVTACAGNGIETTAPYLGLIQNTISWGNGTNFVGTTPANLFSSNGDTALAGVNGNIDADPLFEDASPAVGDLRITDMSPCVGTADFFVSLFVGSDVVDSTRVADRDLDGLARSDMGAHEGAPYVLVFAGAPKSGETMFFAMLGPIGIGFLYIGLDDGLPFFFNPYGLYLGGDANNPFFELGVDANFGYPVTFPLEPSLVGTRFSAQMVGAVAGNLGVGSFTNAYRGIIQD